MVNKVIINITKAKISEAQKIRMLESKVWREEVVNKYDVAMFIRFGWCFVAKDDNKIVGTICSYLTRNNEVYICDWVVQKNYRRINIGVILYKRLIRAIKGRSIVSFVDLKNIPSLKLHKKLGFKIIKRIKNPYNLNEGYRIFMRLRK